MTRLFNVRLALAVAAFAAYYAWCQRCPHLALVKDSRVIITGASSGRRNTVLLLVGVVAGRYAVAAGTSASQLSAG